MAVRPLDRRQRRPSRPDQYPVRGDQRQQRPGHAAERRSGGLCLRQRDGRGVADDTTYIVTVAVGKELATGAGGRPGYGAGISLLANGVAILTGVDVPAGTFEDRSVTFTTAATGDPVVGQNLTTRLLDRQIGDWRSRVR
jgi:hypothetical protein